MKLNYKRKQIQEDRHTEIERENRILLEKMTNILSTHFTTNKKKKAEKRSRTVHQRKAITSNFKRRQNEQVKITLENQHILRRLQDSRATYSVMKWKDDK